MGILTRTSHLIRGLFHRFLSRIERRHPEALLELEKDKLRTLIGQYHQGLASHAALSERLMQQVRRLEQEEGELFAKTQAHLQAGNRDAAARYALRLQAGQKALEDSRQQLLQAETTYQNLVQTRDFAIAEAKARIESIRRAIGDLQLQRATAELQEMAAGMIAEIGGGGDTLQRLHEMVEEERQLAAGRARVARDALTMGDLHLQEIEQQALAEQALRAFEARQDLPGEGARPALSSATPEPLSLAQLREPDPTARR